MTLNLTEFETVIESAGFSLIANETIASLTQIDSTHANARPVWEAAGLLNSCFFKLNVYCFQK